MCVESILKSGLWEKNFDLKGLCTIYPKKCFVTYVIADIKPVNYT